ncbi:16.9 kDa class I heat shock protein 1 [Physcomitrium patens]|uniref:SHSP domain-containing protein n=1 Tax=Physcomitrium patens TaxID=3218 RepID=A0A2K1IZB6_PHYPA|nr:16.9 kDa class I heat shock protein 1-like [Physcomitrium patens]PNR34622.1 hypothetical protein PHYPA_024439 [Physcomitrium patens]|eukprot:XP_024403967.1 16.9 kDa class I heat shock protein 1-like [Physcomitrella patens]
MAADLRDGIRPGIQKSVRLARHLWEPFEALAELQQFDGSRRYNVIHARMDWRETADAHILKTDMPGVRSDDVKVQVIDGEVVEISGTRKKEEPKEGDEWHHVERPSGFFFRSFRIPENAKADDLKAQVADGVLTITLPKKKKPEPQIRQIRISKL